MKKPIDKGKKVIDFIVYGKIAAKGSRTVGIRKNGTTYSRPASKYEKVWTHMVATEARRYNSIAPPYKIHLEFYYAKPKKSKYAWPARLDIDKTVRATLDGLVQAGLIEDDRHVTQLSAAGKWALPLDNKEHCYIAIYRL